MVPVNLLDIIDVDRRIWKFDATSKFRNLRVSRFFDGFSIINR